VSGPSSCLYARREFHATGWRSVWWSDTEDGRYLQSGVLHGNLRAFQQLGTKGQFEDRLEEIVFATEGTEGLAQFYYYLAQLSQWCVLQRSLYAEGELLATLIPIFILFCVAGRSLVPKPAIPTFAIRLHARRRWRDDAGVAALVRAYRAA